MVNRELGAEIRKLKWIIWCPHEHNADSITYSHFPPLKMHGHADVTPKVT